MYDGTIGARNGALARCSAPKTAKGMAKHKLLKATILSRPRAGATSVFAAHSAISRSRTPALHIETTVPEISKNAARMVGCMGTPSVSCVLYRSGFSRSIQLRIVQLEELR